MKQRFVLLIFIGNTIQCIQCGNQENSYQCTGSDSGRSTECPNNIAYCQKISALVHGLTFKQCGMISLPGIDQNEIFAKADLCVPNIVSFLTDIPNETVGLNFNSNIFVISGC